MRRAVSEYFRTSKLRLDMYAYLDRARLLMTIPGISYVTAMTLISEIVDIGRFKTAEKFAAAGGVIPSHRNSASTYRGGGITKQGSVWLRNAIVEASATTIRYDKRRGEIHKRIRKRRGAMKARVAVARHLLEIIWHMLTIYVNSGGIVPRPSWLPSACVLLLCYLLKLCLVECILSLLVQRL